jgi:hypothetical protein
MQPMPGPTQAFQTQSPMFTRREELVGDLTPETSTKIYKFYTDNMTDPYGKTLSEIRAMAQQEMAVDFSWVQSLFPTYRRSDFDPRGLQIPVDMSFVFREDTAFMMVYKQSFMQLLRFMGLEYDDCKEVVQKNPTTFSQHSQDWMRPFNPFYASLTRVLVSLNLFGLHKEAGALNTFLQSPSIKYDSRIDENSPYRWAEAQEQSVRGGFPAKI